MAAVRTITCADCGTCVEAHAPNQKRCRDCASRRASFEWQEALKKKRREDPAYREYERARNREWQRRARQDPAYRARLVERDRLRKYGLTPADYTALLAAQEGLCRVCDKPLPEVPHVDHDHATGHVRGLTHPGCNTGLGQFGDSADRLRRAADYLDNPPAAFLYAETAEAVA